MFIVAMVSQVNTHVKMDQIVHFKHMWLSIFQVYLNKVFVLIKKEHWIGIGRQECQFWHLYKVCVCPWRSLFYFYVSSSFCFKIESDRLCLRSHSVEKFRLKNGLLPIGISFFSWYSNSMLIFKSIYWILRSQTQWTIKWIFWNFEKISI